MFPLRLPAPVGRSPGNASSVWVGSALVPPPPPPRALCRLQNLARGLGAHLPRAPGLGGHRAGCPGCSRDSARSPDCPPCRDQPRLHTAPRHSTQQKTHPLDRKKKNNNKKIYIYTRTSVMALGVHRARAALLGQSRGQCRGCWRCSRVLCIPGQPPCTWAGSSAWGGDFSTVCPQEQVACWRGLNSAGKQGC